MRIWPSGPKIQKGHGNVEAEANTEETRAERWNDDVREGPTALVAESMVKNQEGLDQRRGGWVCRVNLVEGCSLWKGKNPLPGSGRGSDLFDSFRAMFTVQDWRREDQITDRQSCFIHILPQRAVWSLLLQLIQFRWRGLVVSSFLSFFP